MEAWDGIRRWGGVSWQLFGKACLLLRCWQGAAAPVPLGVGAVTQRLLRTGAEPAGGGVLPKRCRLLGSAVGTAPLAAQVRRGGRGRESRPL